MARLHFVKKARKDNKPAGIKAGESYYWWKFRFGGKRFSKTKPPRSTLTQSEFLGQVYDLQDDWSAKEEFDESELEELKSALEEMKSDLEDRLSNMPEQLQESSASGQTLQERIDQLDSAISDLDQVEVPEVDEDVLADQADGEIPDVAEDAEDQEEAKSDREDQISDKIDELKREAFDEALSQINDAIGQLG